MGKHRQKFEINVKASSITLKTIVSWQRYKILNLGTTCENCRQETPMDKCKYK